MKKYLIGLIIIVLLLSGVIVYKKFGNTLAQNPKCSDEYPDTEEGSNERLAAIDAWTNEFYDKNPGASLGDWARARYQFWVENGCDESIQRYNAAKSGAESEAVNRIKEEIINILSEKGQQLN